MKLVGISQDLIEIRITGNLDLAPLPFFQRCPADGELRSVNDGIVLRSENFRRINLLDISRGEGHP